MPKTFQITKTQVGPKNFLFKNFENLIFYIKIIDFEKKEPQIPDLADLNHVVRSKVLGTNTLHFPILKMANSSENQFTGAFLKEENASWYVSDHSIPLPKSDRFIIIFLQTFATFLQTFAEMLQQN